MLRRFGVVCVAVIAATCASVSARSGPNDRTLPMHFELRQEGPAQSCGDKCRLLIFAAGAITSETPVEFRNFAAGRDLRGATVVLDSDGGSVLGAIAFGREIRTRGLATSVGHLRELPELGKDNVAGISAVADCESMCAFVLLAGTQRSVPPAARVMVHQIWLGDRRDDPTAANYSAEDLVLVQRDIGRLARYTVDMGGPAELLELALRIPPWEPMHALTRDELRRMSLDTLATAGQDRLPAETTAAVVTPTSAIRSLAGEQGWSIASRGGATALVRRHPLTVEGDEIGTFDLAIACGGEEDGYVVNYSERRQAGIAVNKPDNVTLRVGPYSAALKVVASTRNKAAEEMQTMATGVVPASLIKAFTALGNHSMTVSTTSGSFVTTIRLGNSGAARNLPLLGSACRKSMGDRAEALPQKTGGLGQRQ